MTVSSWQAVYKVVRRIPAGRVSTYGTIATLSGMPGAARQVGWALNALGRNPAEGPPHRTTPRNASEVTVEDTVPWHRVINAQGKVSARGERTVEDLQRALLECEGVAFDDRGRVDLEEFGWQPQRPNARSAAQKTKRATPTPTPTPTPTAKTTEKRVPGAASRKASRDTGARR